jgi:hypothetical protein
MSSETMAPSTTTIIDIQSESTSSIVIQSESTTETSSSTGAVVGGAVGGSAGALALVVAIGVFIFGRRRKQPTGEKYAESGESGKSYQTTMPDFAPSVEYADVDDVRATSGTGYEI